jgi:hypothetical protein
MSFGLTTNKWQQAVPDLEIYGNGQGQGKYRSGEQKQEKTLMSRLPVTSLEISCEVTASLTNIDIGGFSCFCSPDLYILVAALGTAYS